MKFCRNQVNMSVSRKVSKFGLFILVNDVVYATKLDGINGCIIKTNVTFGFMYLTRLFACLMLTHLTMIPADCCPGHTSTALLDLVELVEFEPR